MMRPRVKFRSLAPVITLIAVLLQYPVDMALRLLLPDADVSTVSAYLFTLCREPLLWLLPALLLLPWRTRPLSARQDLPWLMRLALPLGVLLQWSLIGLRILLPMPSSPTLPGPQTPAEWALAVLALGIAPAVCEEAFFRGGLLSCLRQKTSPVAAMALTTVIFALMHGSPTGLPGHLLISAACTLAMMGSGSVLPAMLLHLGYNLTAIFSAYLPASPWLALLGLVPMSLLLLTAWRMRWQSSERHLSRTELGVLLLVILIQALRYLP